MLPRKVDLQDAKNESVFLWGARQTGKSTLLKALFPNERYIDLLKSGEFERYNRRPALLREELTLLPENSLVIIDEIQKIPMLLNEVHWLITNKNIRFILSGSSARKLRRSGVNLLGGRAIRKHLYPFVSAETPDFDLVKACNNGMLPRHYLINNVKNRLNAYVGDYLQQEIKAEALTRNLSTFSRFMEVAALSNGEIINYNNIASECGVSAPTVKEYFSILEETLIGYIIPAFTKNVKRRVIQSPKFYYFDVGIANFLLRRDSLLPGSPEFGHSFEHLIMQELIAYLSYSDSKHSLAYWRTTSGYEVDAILGNAHTAIEIKCTREVHSHHTKGLKAFSTEFPDSCLIMVSLDTYPRLMNNINILPVKDFLTMLWSGEII